MDGYRVVGFGVEPISVNHRFPANYEWDGMSIEGFVKALETCPSRTESFISQETVQRVQVVRPGQQILYTYDATWHRSDVAWSSRWDVYLTEDHFVPAQVRWYSIVNSLVVILFLSVTVTCVLVGNLRKDVAAARGRSTLSEQDTGQMEDEKGWKALHGDVFRPPQTKPILFCACLGAGAQLAVTAVVVIVFGMIGWVSPARRGSLLNASLAVYTLCSFIAGYVSSCLYKAIDGSEWKQCNQLTATIFPGAAFAIFFPINIVSSFLRSSAAVSVLDVLMLACLWGFISFPLTTFGSRTGYFNAKSVEFPAVAFHIARPIPSPSWLWKTPVLSMIITGFFTFATIYVEFFFIMTSLWMNQYYYVFGFTFIVYVAALITCSELTILAVYYRLKAENHQWWWQAFFWSGSVAFFMFGYSMVYLATLEPSRFVVTYWIYHGYMLLVSFAAFLCFGSVGFIASMLFVRRMYSVVNTEADEGYVELLDNSDESLEEHGLVLTEAVAAVVAGET